MAWPFHTFSKSFKRRSFHFRPRLEGMEDRVVPTPLQLVSQHASSSALNPDGEARIQETYQGNAFKSQISQDGRFVVFTSAALNVVPGQQDTNVLYGGYDVFVFDRVDGTTRLVSGVDGSPTQTGNYGGGAYDGGTISADGRYIAFLSGSTNLVNGQPDTAAGIMNVFLFDRVAGTTRLVCSAAESMQRGSPILSADGRYIAFTSNRSDVVANQVDNNGSTDVFVFDCENGTTRLVSGVDGSATITGNNISINPAISADGRFISFTSLSTNLVSGQAGRVMNVFAFDRLTGETRLVSGVGGSTTEAGGGTSWSSISADGRFVGFTGGLVNLVTGETTPSQTQNTVYVFDRTSGTTQMVSHIPGSTTDPANGSSVAASISADGRFIAFQSNGTDLFANQTGFYGSDNIFVYDRTTAEVQLVSRAAGSTTQVGNGQSYNPVLSSNGRFIAFFGSSTDLIDRHVPGSNSNVFAFDRATGTMQLVSGAAGSSTIGGNNIGSYSPAISADGRFIAFNSYSSDLVASDNNDLKDVFLFAMPPPPPQGGGLSLMVAISGGSDGSAAVFAPDTAGQFSSPTALAPFGTIPVDMRAAVADIDDDGREDSILVTGPGTAIRVAVISGADNSTVLVPPFDPFGGNFTGGGFVAAADIDGDGRAEFAVTPDQGGGPRVTIFSLLANGSVQTKANFFGIDDEAFRGGARAALGDINDDGTPDLLLAAGFGGGPRVAVFDGDAVLSNTRTKLVPDFFAFPEDAQTLRNGVFAALGDINGDGFADLVFGGGPGGGPRVLVLSGQLLMSGSPNLFSQPIANFFVAGNGNDRGGVRLAVKNADGDSKADLVVGSGAGSPAKVRVYLGSNFINTGEPATFQDITVFGGLAMADGVYVG